MCVNLLKGHSRENFPVDIYFKFLLQSDNVKMQKMGVTDVSEIKRVDNYPNFEKSVHVIRHDLHGYLVKNVDGESTEANDLSHIL